MFVAAARVELHVHGSQSLKQKRGVISSIKKRVRNEFNVSVAEVGGQDTWQVAVLGLAAVSEEAQDARVRLERQDAKASLPREALYWHYPHYSNQVSKPGAAIRAGEWKLIEFYEDGRRELFNVGKNAGEGQNMIADQPAIAKELGDKLDAWRKEVGAQMMTENPNYTPGPQDKQGVITLHARHASVHGIMLRYEPLPHKDTLGYWVRADDWASFEFTVTTPGKFEIEALQGCGKGSGGSEVNFGVGEQVVKMVVEDTGHFQNFKPRVIGQITIEKAGRYTLTVKPQKKPGVAVMDLRAVTLKPVK